MESGDVISLQERKKYLFMKGIIFVVWEKYLNERFESSFVDTYRNNIGETKDQLPITGRTRANCKNPG